MNEKRTYTSVVASIETHIEHISNHLQNIDTHLERLNNSQGEQDEQISQNGNNITWVIKIGGGILVLILIPILLKFLEVI